MSFAIQPNIDILRSQRSVTRGQDEIRKSYDRLSSGDRLTNAADDAAGYAQSNRLRAETRALQQAARNAGDGFALAGTADSALGQMTDILHRMRELALQSSNASPSMTDRQAIDQEFRSLRDEMDRIAKGTRYGDVTLLDGGISSGAAFIVGSNGSQDVVSLALGSLRSSDLGLPAARLSAQSLSTSTGARSALQVIDAAAAEVQSARGAVGAAESRFQRASEDLAAAAEATTTADGRIRDVDVAKETAALAQRQMLLQAGVSLLAQANQLPQMALQLLKS